MFSRSDKMYCALAALFSTCLVLSNILGVKIFSIPLFPGYSFPGGIFLYPITFLATDIIAEIWGKSRANYVVFTAFFMNLFSLLAVQMVITLVPDGHWVVPGNAYGYGTPEEYQTAFSSVFDGNMFLVLASSAAYLVAQFLDIRIFNFFKTLTHGKYLWLRNNASTMTSQAVDSVIFGFIFFYVGLGIPWIIVVQMMFSLTLFKWVLALCDTPFCYLGVGLIRRFQREEVIESQDEHPQDGRA